MIETPIFHRKKNKPKHHTHTPPPPPIMGYFFSLLPLKYNVMTLKCFISLSSLHKWVPKYLFRFTPEYPTPNFRDPLMFGNPRVAYVQGAKLSFRLLDFHVHLGQGGLNNEKI